MGGSMMRKKRKEGGIAEHQKKREQFIREQVRPEQKKSIFQWIKRTGILMLTAVLFGVTAGSVMVVIHNHYIEEEKEVIKLMSYAEASKEPAEQADDTESGENAKQEKLTSVSLAKVNKITQRLAAVGTGMSPAVVGILQEVSAQSLLTGDDGNMAVAYGLLVEETEEVYYILTTNEIIKERSVVPVQLLDQTTVSGKVLGSDTQLNMAVVRIRKKDIRVNLRNQMSVAKLSNGMGLLNGSNVIAVGCPNGVLRSVIVGRVTNDSLKGSITDGEVQLYCTDIPFTYEGNGVVVDINGRVVGLITNSFTEKTGEAGLSFIKISDVMQVLELLKKRQSAPYLGMEGITLSVMQASAHGLEKGIYVTEIYSGSPAYHGGMRVADVIMEIDGKTVSGMSDIYQNLLKHKPGDSVVYTVNRKAGKEQTKKKIEITLE